MSVVARISGFLPANTIVSAVQQTWNFVPFRLLHQTNLNFKSFKQWYRDLWAPNNANREPPYSHITQIGDPILRQKSEPVPQDYVNSEQIKFLVDQMINVMQEYDLVGIAAPQIGIALRIIAMEFSAEKFDRFTKAVREARKMSTMPLTVVINPTLKIVNFNKVKFPEGCASVKGYSAEVERYEEALLSGLSRNGDNIELNLKGWNARIAQHEMDHLDGKIYTDVMDRSTFNCTCWQAINSHAGRVEIRFTPK